MNMKFDKSCGLVWLLATGLMIGCSSHGEPDIQLEKEVSEIFKDMDRLPSVKDPDPIIEDPDYEEIFDPAYSMRLLDDVLEGGAVPQDLRKCCKRWQMRFGRRVRKFKKNFKRLLWTF